MPRPGEDRSDVGEAAQFRTCPAFHFCPAFRFSRFPLLPLSASVPLSASRKSVFTSIQLRNLG